MVSNTIHTKPFYIYNYEGYFFRVFETKNEVLKFFNLGFESKFNFNSEEEMDDYLINVKFKNIF